MNSKQMTTMEKKVNDSNPTRIKALLSILDNERGYQIAEEMKLWLSERYDVIDFVHDGKQYEYPGIRKACEICVETNEPVLYIHTKGAANPNDMQPIVRDMWRNQFVNDYDFYTCHKSGLSTPEISPDLRTWFNAWIVWPDIARFYLEKMVLSENRYYYENLPRELGLKESDLHYKVKCEQPQACLECVKLSRNNQLSREKGKTNILYITNDTQGGVFYYRCLTPMMALKNNYPDKHDVFITNDLDTVWQQIKDIDILIIHNCLYDNKTQMQVWNLVTEAKKVGIKTVLDMDDYWNYGQEHPMFNICIANSYPVKATVNFSLFDCITTTTERLKAEIYPYNRNVHVLENAISQDDHQFTKNKIPSRRLRFGLTGGSSHTNDIRQIVNEEESVFDYLDKDMVDRIQFVLCGFNIQGKRIKIDENGRQTQEDLNTDEIWWVQLEKQITKDYSIVSPEYKELLLKYDGSDEQYDASDEPYRRIWIKSIKDFEYGKIYDNIDVLMVPLTDTKFNSMKSELKFIESGFTNTAILSSKVKPYTDYGTDGMNCIFVDDMTPKGWAYNMVRLYKNEPLRNNLASELNKKVVKERDIDLISKKRDELYQSMVKK